MAVSVDVLRIHLDYNAWASELLVDAARRLSPDELTRDFKTSDKSVLGTLLHVFGADRVWLRRMHGHSPTVFLHPGEDNLEALSGAWPSVLQEWKDWAGELTEAQAEEPIAYRDMAGNPHVQPPWQIVLHLVNHGTHHRGAVSGVLRAMGHTPPKLDLVHYYRTVESSRGAAS